MRAERRLTFVVSIHAPREGCDFNEFGPKTSQSVSIHAPREGCDLQLARDLRSNVVSIHAPREGCDFVGWHPLCRCYVFQFTHPGRGATSSFFMSLS